MLVPVPEVTHDAQTVSNAAIRLYRPGGRLGFVIFNPAFEVRIDGDSRGSLWPKQVRTFSVPPGTHEVKVRALAFRLGRKKAVTVSPRQTVELVLPREWKVTLSGVVWLQEATEEERRQMHELLAAQVETQDPPIGD